MKPLYQRIFLAVSVLALSLAIGYGFLNLHEKLNFAVRAAVSCDETLMDCFDHEGEPYIYITMPATLYKLCVSHDSCLEQCKQNNECSIEYCSEATLTEGETCYDASEAEPEVSDTDEQI